MPKNKSSDKVIASSSKRIKSKNTNKTQTDDEEEARTLSDDEDEEARTLSDDDENDDE